MIGRLYYFTPPERSVPDWRSTYVAVILRRANALLEQRKPREIQFMLDSISYLLWQGLPALLPTAKGGERVNVNPAVILRNQIPRIDIDDQADVPGARWPEYFAALAIALCEKTFIEERECLGPEPHTEVVDPPELRLDPELLCHAAEAVATAELLQSEIPAAAGLEAVENRIKLSTEKANIARWAPAREIKDRFVMEFRNGTHGQLPVRDAAQQFYSKLSDTEQRILCPSLISQNAVRTLVEYYNRAIGAE